MSSLAPALHQSSVQMSWITESDLRRNSTMVLLAELWHAPEPNREVSWGVGDDRLAPDRTATWRVLEVNQAGFSEGVTVEGPGGRKWNVTFPPDATEVVASRILWAAGYHQPPLTRDRGLS